MSGYQGNIVIKNPTAPAGPTENGAAPGIWSLNDALTFKRQGIWPTQGIKPNDPYFGYVSMLLSTTSLGNANNNLFVDSSGAFNPISRIGNTTQGSMTPYGANWSNYFDGSGDWVQFPSSSQFAIASSSTPFTIEAWIYPTAAGSCIFSDAYTGGGDNIPIVVSLSNGSNVESISGQYVAIGYFNGSSWVTAAKASSQVSLNTWTHIACVFTGSTFKIYYNGVDVTAAGAGSSWGMTGNAGSGWYIGRRWDIFANDYFTGYISNFRFVNGTAVYTSAFTPSTTPLTAISGTVLLTCQSNRFRDASANNFTTTRNGNTRTTDFSPFSPGQSGIVYNQSDITNWSGYFDGSGDYLQLASATPLDLASGDFTVEFWGYPTVKTNVVDAAFGYGSFTLMCYHNGTNWTVEGSNNGSSLQFQISTPVTLGAWQHIAITRSGNTITLYKDGVSAATGSLTGAINTSGKTLRIGDNGNSQFFTGGISNFRIVKGTAVYTANFTPSTTNLTAISGTSLLTLQNAAFTDNSTNNFIITQFGNTTVTGNSPFNTVGYWSNYFDGTGDYLSAGSNSAFAFGTGDFTVECWFYAATSSTSQMLVSTDATNGFFLGFDGTFNFGIRGVSFILAYTPSNYLGQWNHVAVSRSGSTISMFWNGSRVTTTTNSTNFSVTGPLVIGALPAASAYYWTGGISNLRVVKGSAVYNPSSSTITVPTAPLTAISGTSILTCQNGRFIDNSTNAFAITVNGNTSAQSFDPFYTATIASNGGSMYFDGSSDYLVVPYSPTLNILSGDFTVETWVYPTQVSGIVPFLAQWQQTVNLAGFLLASNGANFVFYFAPVSTAAPILSSSTTFTADSWYHIAVVRSGTTFTMYVNGVSVGSTTTSATLSPIGINVSMGNYYGGSGTFPATGVVDFAGYLSGARITKSVVYASAFTPPTAPAASTPATTLLVNGMNAGAYDATAINNMETVGNAQVSTAVSKFGGSSIALDGTGDYLKAPNSDVFAFRTGDFTVEMWAYFADNAATNRPLFDTGVSSNTGRLLIRQGNDAGTSNVVNAFVSGTTVGSPTISFNQWTHVAVVRQSGTVKIYINGTGGTGVSASADLTQNGCLVGAFYDQLAWNFTGYIDDLRVTRGYARYTANFTPPTAPFINY